MPVRTTLATVAAFAALAAGAAALPNPLVAKLRPVGPHGARGNVTLFRIRSNVDLGLNVRGGWWSGEIELRKGTCAHYAARGRPVGHSEQTAFPHAALRQFVGSVVLLHRTRDLGSPVAGCAEIRAS